MLVNFRPGLTLSMKIIIQRVKSANVKVNGQKVAEIGKGLLLLVGISKKDTKESAQKAAQKIMKMRLFPDEKHDINVSVAKIGGEILAVSQFTLLGDISGGNRPSFIEAAKPQIALELFNLFVQELKKLGARVQTGEFGKYMEVELINQGPVTIVADF